MGIDGERAGHAAAQRVIEDQRFVRVNSVIKKRGRTLPPSTAGFLERLLPEMARAEKKK